MKYYIYRKIHFIFCLDNNQFYNRSNVYLIIERQYILQFRLTESTFRRRNITKGMLHKNTSISHFQLLIKRVNNPANGVRDFGDFRVRFPQRDVLVE